MMHPTRSGSGWRRTISIVVIVLCSLAGPAAALAFEDAADGRWTRQRGDRISVFSGDIEIPEGVEQLGSVVCIGGDVIVNGRVSQDVSVILGSLTVKGEIGGAASAVLSEVSLEDSRVRRDLVNVLGSLSMENSRVGGDVVSVLGPLDRDALSRAGGEFVKVGSAVWTPDFRMLAFWLRISLLFIVFTALVALTLIAPDRIRRMASEAAPRYVTAFLVGLLGYLGLLVLLALLSVTIVGVPVLLLAFFVIKWMGVAAIFDAVGRRFGRSFGVDFSPLGAVLSTFALYAAISALPLLLGPVGLIPSTMLAIVFWLLVKVPAVGLVLITRFGTPREPGRNAPPMARDVPDPPAAPPPPPAEASGSPPAG